MELLQELILAGLTSLWDYIALHVLTCLIPAFLLAGAMVSFISKETIIRYLGHAVNKLQSFLTAAFGSFFLAACSCTVIPVASGLYYRGSGIGPAFILLWVAPAANILALTYTGAILGGEMVAVRVVSALMMALVIGTIMTGAFRREEVERAGTSDETMTGKIISRQDIVLIILLVISLLAPNYLIQSGPFWQKVIVWSIATALVAAYAVKVKTNDQLIEWMKETWWFVRIIFPLLLIGVFIVGVIGAILPQSWVENYLGGSSMPASFLATLIGSISYFATMTEAPFVDTLMKMGMGKGPALALLLTGPGLSLPNWLAIARVFGVKKALLYVVTIIALGTVVGWFAGNFVF
ncbi:MAG: permease [Ignavibacteria bacterium]|nr:permease [Ignavibacteria bacterium]